MTILPLTYLGNIHYFSRLYAGKCVIDLGEHYVKQTLRNRCEIMTAEGRTSLTVNVVRGGSKTKRPMRDMRIDYSKRWQHQHWLSLVSAYRNSPYFEHFEEHFTPFYQRRIEFLADLNIGLLDVIIKLIGHHPDLSFSDSYIAATEADEDLRGAMSPQSKIVPSSVIAPAATLSVPAPFSTAPYYQVFSERFPFEPNLSVVDLLFCEGPQAIKYLRII